MQKSLRIIITLAIAVAAILAGIWLWKYYMYSPWTRDGRIRAQVVTVAPDVSGWVRTLHVRDNEQVQQGDPLFMVDDARYQAMVNQDQASVMQRKFSWQQAQHQYERRKSLSKNAISSEDLESSRIQAEVARATYQQALAKLSADKINLARVAVTAPVAGSVINLQLRQGNYIKQGQASLSIVKQGSFYATGYFEETKIPSIQVGDKAEVYLMSGARRIPGHVASIGQGISNQNTTPDGQLLPRIQQTFTWVRLAQRIPVDIVFDHMPTDIKLSAGMTATIKIAGHSADDTDTVVREASGSHAEAGSDGALSDRG
ncbi:efflux RND transporter periplasmic adaptor subunit [Larsenimonas rhizosphaerae]|uniref:efflux RND transporter periplasmic adaptor subunit n=1 Tax=Larsenimonas rhizosphaerae TaxID=2944682 RepID=UPI00203454D6|nr:HlyD family secretion protein [Larsenimonas rhizosphaerae]MCM2131907.1 HlyD family secretion protein [Larsenimonas rhizosphaerae]